MNNSAPNPHCEWATESNRHRKKSDKQKLVEHTIRKCMQAKRETEGTVHARHFAVTDKAANGTNKIKRRMKIISIGTKLIIIIAGVSVFNVHKLQFRFGI